MLKNNGKFIFRYMAKADVRLVDLIEAVVEGFDRLEDCLDRIGDRLDQLDGRLDGVEGRMVSLEVDLREIAIRLGMKT